MIGLNDQYFETLSLSSNGVAEGNDNNDNDDGIDINIDIDTDTDRPVLVYNKRHRSLMECFDIFSEIGKVIVDLDAIRRITREALEDFAKEGVVYLELRSTPKRLLGKRRRCDGSFSLALVTTDELATKRQYCETVINTLIDFRKEEEERYAKESEDANKSKSNPRLPMIASFIVSVDRSNPVECGFEHIDLAIELAKDYPGIVVGVDLGGNPMKSSFVDFRDCFEKARRSGLLSITLHCAEVPCTDDDQNSQAYKDAQAILDFGPARLGHALILPPSLQQQLAKLKIPVETCPTSNVMTTELVEKSSGGSLVDGVKRHPQLQKWLQDKHPLCICTDDPGVFDTNATQEFVLRKC
jgi:adenosine deaminase